MFQWFFRLFEQWQVLDDLGGEAASPEPELEIDENGEIAALPARADPGDQAEG